MNLYEVFNTQERELISKIEKIEKIENRNYTKEEISRIENRVIEDIMSNSKKNISSVRDQYNGIIDKLESV